MFHCMVYYVVLCYIILYNVPHKHTQAAWMSNGVKLLNLLRQFSGEEVRGWFEQNKKKIRIKTSKE